MTIKKIKTSKFDDSLRVTVFRKPDFLLGDTQYGRVRFKKWLEHEAKRMKKVGVMVIENESGDLALARKE